MAFMMFCAIIFGIFWSSVAKPYLKDDDHPKDE